MIEIPAIVMGGTDPSSVIAVAETGVEFVAMRSGVFDNAAGAAQAVSEINALLDEKRHGLAVDTGDVHALGSFLPFRFADDADFWRVGGHCFCPVRTAERKQRAFPADGG